MKPKIDNRTPNHGVKGWLMPLRTTLFLSLLLMLLLTTACQHNSDADSPAADDNGELVIGLTDAEGDFSSYTVDVTSLTLTKANGAVVNVLPLSTRVDFAQYTEMTEFLTAAMVPLGAYVNATMALDYSNADIHVENAAGELVRVSAIHDSDGNVITALDVSVRLEGRNKLVIAPGVPSHVTFDFDLRASNQVEFDVTTGAAGLVVEPFLLADVALDAPKIHRVRGPLASVDVDRNQFDVIIRPFHHLHSDDRRFGSLTVKTSDETLFEINQETYQGSVGLAELDNLPRLTATVVIGDLKLNPRRFVAREVYAGSSVPGGVLDVARGTVIARSGNELTLKGATLIRANGSVIFNDTILITIAESTRVKKQFSMLDHGIDEISVGQHIGVFGTLTSTSTTDLQLDATAGMVRMKLSTLRGNSVPVASIPEIDPPLVMDLQSINGRRVSLYDFAGTGIDAEHDADPAYYQINTIAPNGGVLDLSGLAGNTPVKVRGFVTPFGSAPADFDALSVVDLTGVPAIMAMNWAPASDSPFLALSATGLTLDSNGTGLFHHVSRGGVVHDLAGLSGNPQILANEAGAGLFEIRQGAVYVVHTLFANFVTDLETRLASGGTVKRIVATGIFNNVDASLVANTVRVIMKTDMSTVPAAAATGKVSLQ